MAKLKRAGRILFLIEYRPGSSWCENILQERKTGEKKRTWTLLVWEETSSSAAWRARSFKFHFDLISPEIIVHTVLLLAKYFKSKLIILYYILKYFVIYFKIKDYIIILYHYSKSKLIFLYYIIIIQNQSLYFYIITIQNQSFLLCQLVSCCSQLLPCPDKYFFLSWQVNFLSWQVYFLSCQIICLSWQVFFCPDK